MVSASYSSDGNIAWLLIAPHIVFSILATISVAVRLYVGRHGCGTSCTAEAYFCVVALVSSLFIRHIHGFIPIQLALRFLVHLGLQLLPADCRGRL